MNVINFEEDLALLTDMSALLGNPIALVAVLIVDVLWIVLMLVIRQRSDEFLHQKRRTVGGKFVQKNCWRRA